MLMWVMSDRAHPAQLPHDGGLRRAHLPARQRARASRASSSSTGSPMLGMHSLVWDEAVKIAGADPDFHRRDLWDAIEAGDYPGVGARRADLHRRAGRAASASTCSTRPRSSPRNWCRCSPVGRMMLNRNPDNFFAETEQVAFCTAHVVPGIDFTNDPLLAGPHPLVPRHAAHAAWAARTSTRSRSTRRSRPVHNNQRDGMHRQAIHRGRVAYEPNSLGGGCPFQAGARGLRRRSRSRCDERQGARQAGEVRRPLHAGDAVLRTARPPVEQEHIVGGVPLRADASSRCRRSASACCRRCVNVSPSSPPRSPTGLGWRAGGDAEVLGGSAARRRSRVAGAVADGACPGRRRRSAPARSRILVADGVDGALDRRAAGGAAWTPARCHRDRAAPRARSQPTAASRCEAARSLENSPPVLFDALVLPDGEAGVARLAEHGQALEFITNQYRHGKTMLALGASRTLLELAGIPATLSSGKPDPGVLVCAGVSAGADLDAAARGFHHRGRQASPPGARNRSAAGMRSCPLAHRFAPPIG